MGRVDQEAPIRLHPFGLKHPASAASAAVDDADGGGGGGDDREALRVCPVHSDDLNNGKGNSSGSSLEQKPCEELLP